MIGDSVQNSPTVLVVDDDETVRSSIQSLLRSVGLQVRVFDSAEQLLAGPVPDPPCCLVLDVKLPGINGLDFQSELEKAGIHVPIIFVTGYGDIPMTVKAMKAGAIEFLAKPFREREFLDAVNAAIVKSSNDRESNQWLERIRKDYLGLTPREREVIVLVVSGFMNKQIAWKLGITEITVKVHRGNVMRKMGAKSLADLVRISDALELRHQGS